ncbi:MAG: SpoIIE family protein phosphatase [Gallionellaceae bacterium]|jgi:serine phosphatase RsbU (regulator of sigma subunit)/anti-sigma regulatory factor (Ser/Thr protein kinase)
MKAWWFNLSLHNKLQIPIQVLLLLVLILAQIWVARQFEATLFADAEKRAIDSATQSFLSLNAMMLNGNISQPHARDTYIKKMASQDGVTDFHVVRAQPVIDQFGPGLATEVTRDELDRQAITRNQIQIHRQLDKKRTLRVVVPFAAETDFHGTNCLQCHLISLGQVAGAVSLTLSLQHEFTQLSKLHWLLSIGQVLLQLLLFFMIRILIQNVLRPIINLEQTMLAIKAEGDLNKLAEVESGDEVGHITRVFNEFLQYIRQLKKELADKVLVLEQYHDRTEEELRVGGFIMEKMIQVPEQLINRVQFFSQPVEHLGGDILIAAKSPDGAVNILLADAIGHGLVAAINVLPLCQTFYDLTEKGFSPGQIATDLNILVNKYLPSDRFVSAAIVSLHQQSGVIQVWNGGIPAILLFNHAGKTLHQWASHHLPLGIASGEDFSAKIESYHCEENAQLFLFSDGLVEMSSPLGLAFGEEGIIELLSKTPPEQRFVTLISGIEKHLDGQAAHDDISLGLINVRYAEDVQVSALQVSTGKHSATADNWHIAVTLGAAELKYLDIVPLLTQIISKMELTHEHHSAVFMILSELFNNALDHGLLHLDSALKMGPDGFEVYLESREAQLQALQTGSIKIEISPVEIDQHSAIKIKVADSGEGFCPIVFTGDITTRPSELPYGRGIALVKSVAYQLDYSERGNEVAATYLCD